MKRSENENKKKTNYQRLWRKSKKQEILSHNFAEDVVSLCKMIMKKIDKKGVHTNELEAAILELRNRYNKASINN